MLAFPYLKGAYRKAGERLLNKTCSYRVKGNGFKLKESMFSLSVRNKSFTVRVTHTETGQRPIPGSVVGQAG